MSSKLEQLFPAFLEIQDEQLRALSQKAMKLAMERGGWTYENLHLCPVTLCAQTDRLVQDEHLRILIDDRQRLGNLQKGPVRLLLAQQLRRQKQLDHISFTQPLIDGTALAVDLDLLVADGLVQRAFGKRREHLHQKTVGALSLVIVVDDNFFHGDHLAIVYHIPEKMW